MKTVFKTDEIPHLWINQSVEHARNYGNLFFEGPIIYSYGRHFPAAKIFPEKNLVLINSNSYSNTTAGHLRAIEGAIPRGTLKVIHVPNPEGNYIHHHIQNVECFISNMKQAAEKLIRARKKSIYINDFERNREQLNEYVGIFKIKTKIKGLKQWLNAEITGATEILQKERQSAERERKARLQKAIAKFQEELPEWRNGKGGSLKNPLNLAYLRLSADGTEIETTMGARVPVREAKILFDRIYQGKDVKGYQIGYYTVIGINGTLKVGCHEIPRDEINDFATKIGWI